VYADTLKKNIKYKNKTAISPESVDEEADLDKENMTKGKIPAFVMWYLPVIDRLKCVFSNPRDLELVCWHSEKRMEVMRRFDTLRMELSGNFLIFSIQNF
jgi:hypothetical protein